MGRWPDADAWVTPQWMPLRGAPNLSPGAPSAVCLALPASPFLPPLRSWPSSSDPVATGCRGRLLSPPQLHASKLPPRSLSRCGCQDFPLGDGVLGVGPMAGAGLRRVAWRRFGNVPVFSEPWLLSVDLESTSQGPFSPLYSHSPERGSADIPYPCSALYWVTLLPFRHEAFAVCVWSFGRCRLRALPPTYAHLPGEEAIP